MNDDKRLALSIICPSCSVYAGKPCVRENGSVREWPHAARLTAARTDPLLRAMSKPCADCGHVQAWHCPGATGHESCGCIPHPRTPAELRCQCKQFVDSEVTR